MEDDNIHIYIYIYVYSYIYILNPLLLCIPPATRPAIGPPEASGADMALLLRSDETVQLQLS